MAGLARLPEGEVLLLSPCRCIQQPGRLVFLSLPPVPDGHQGVLLLVQVVQELRLECAALDQSKRARAPTAVAWSLQRYLIFAILSCIPDRCACATWSLS